EGADDGLRLSAGENSLHDQRVGDDKSGELELAAKQVGENGTGESSGHAARVERGKSDVGRHDRRHSPLDCAAKRNEIGLAKDVGRSLDARQLLVRVDRCPPVPREVLGTGEYSLRLTGIYPRGGAFADALRIGAERPGADDRVVGLDIEVAVGSVNPVDSQLARFFRGYRRGATDGLE